jgi:hypothetical protein
LWLAAFNASLERSVREIAASKIRRLTVMTVTAE